jgi:hypothetical protein
MEIRMQDGGRVWVDEQFPYWKDWRGKQAYKFAVSQKRVREAHAARNMTASTAPSS